MNTVSIENEGKQRQVLHKGTPSYEEYKRKAVKSKKKKNTQKERKHGFFTEYFKMAEVEEEDDDDGETVIFHF
ncbi:hypothetical protein SDJN02_04819, partial [Cucurbita argyrosperma subsp. argyrosperma]